MMPPLVAPLPSKSSHHQLITMASFDFVFVLLALLPFCCQSQRFECGEKGTRCMGHISGFAKDVVSYEECAFRCREHNYRSKTLEERCNWFTFSRLWNRMSTNSFLDYGNSLDSDKPLPPTLSTECRFYVDCPNIAPCPDCVSGHKQCIETVI